MTMRLLTWIFLFICLNFSCSESNEKGRLILEGIVSGVSVEGPVELSLKGISRSIDAYGNSIVTETFLPKVITTPKGRFGYHSKWSFDSIEIGVISEKYELLSETKFTIHAFQKLDVELMLIPKAKIDFASN